MTFRSFVFQPTYTDMSHPHHKVVILSGALRRSIGNRGFMARSRRTPGVLLRPVLYVPFPSPDGLASLFARAKARIVSILLCRWPGRTCSRAWLLKMLVQHRSEKGLRG